MQFKPGRVMRTMPYRELVDKSEGGLEKRGGAITIPATLTVEVLGEQYSGVRGHRAAPARIFNVVAGAVDASVLERLVTFYAMHRGARFTKRGAPQAQRRYVASTIVFI